MRIVTLYFSRTGKTKNMAEAIAEDLKAALFSISSMDPAIIKNYDVIIFGTPVEGSRPAKEATTFIEGLPTTDGKKIILFCTYRFFKGMTFKVMSKAFSIKGYNTVLEVSKRNVKIDETCFSEIIAEIKKAISQEPN